MAEVAAKVVEVNRMDVVVLMNQAVVAKTPAVEVNLVKEDLAQAVEDLARAAEDLAQAVEDLVQDRKEVNLDLARNLVVKEDNLDQDHNLVVREVNLDLALHPAALKAAVKDKTKTRSPMKSATSRLSNQRVREDKEVKDLAHHLVQAAHLETLHLEALHQADLHQADLHLVAHRKEDLPTLSQRPSLLHFPLLIVVFHSWFKVPNT